MTDEKIKSFTHERTFNLFYHSGSKLIRLAIIDKRDFLVRRSTPKCSTYYFSASSSTKKKKNWIKVDIKSRMRGNYHFSSQFRRIRSPHAFHLRSIGLMRSHTAHLSDKESLKKPFRASCLPPRSASPTNNNNRNKFLSFSLSSSSFDEWVVNMFESERKYLPPPSFIFPRRCSASARAAARKGKER